jgi:threonyl-tRNA synthetase
VPFMLLAGDKDVQAGAVSFRFGDRSQINGVPREHAVAAIREWIENRQNVVPTAESVKVRGD